MFWPVLDQSPENSLLGQSSLLKRISENLKFVWRMPLAPASGNAGPFPLLNVRRSGAKGQIGSTCLHLFLCAAVAFVVVERGKKPPVGSSEAQSLGPLAYSAPDWLQPQEKPSLGRHGSGGDLNPLPPTAGELAAPAKYEFAPPRLPDNQAHALLVPVTIFDPQAPNNVPQPKELGLPWLRTITNSAGPGTNGIGSRKGHGMGDMDGDGEGEGDDGHLYAPAATPVVCKYCPDPTYTDEARNAKLQGSVTLRVLVGQDGRAQAIQITKGLGLGLDERAEEAVKSWQFIPAKNAAHHPIASWVVIETTYRLF